MKRIIGVILCSFIACAGALHSLAATETVNGITWIYTVSNDVATIGYEYSNVTIPAIGEYVHGDIVVPDILGGCPVARIGESAFFRCTNLTSVLIPETVTSIGSHAFYECSGITNIALLGHGVKSIEQCTFYGCIGLNEFTIPDSVSEIGYSAFSGCTNLADIVIPNSVKTIQPRAFEDCSALTKVTLPEGISEVRGQTFWRCCGLTDLAIPNSVTSIWWSAFEGCSSLTSITIPDSVEHIGADAFRGCGGLRSISVGIDNPSYISVNGLLLSKDGKTLIRGISGGDMIIPQGVYKIEEYAFDGCIGLTSISGNNAVNVGYRAFEGCINLTNVAFYIDYMGGEVFKNCCRLSSITLPKFDDGAYSVFLKGGILSGNFPGCRDLADRNGVLISGTPEYRDNGVLKRDRFLEDFFGNAEAVVIPAEITSISRSAFCCNETVKKVFISTDYDGNTNMIYSSIEFVRYQPNQVVTFDAVGGCVVPVTTNVQFGVKYGVLPEPQRQGYSFGGWTLDGERISWDSIVWALEDHMLKAVWFVNQYLVTFDANGGEGGTSATMDYGTEIVAPTVIREGCTFEGWSPAVPVTVPASNSTYVAKWKVWSAVVDSTAKNMRTQYPKDYQSITNVALSFGIAEIPDGFFDGCNSLVSIVIPDSVTNIADYAFAGCTNLQTEVQGGYKVINGWVVGYTDEAEETIPDADSLKGICGGALMGCAALKRLEFGDRARLVSIGAEALKGCTELKTLVLPPSLTRIGNEAFMGCSYLDDVIVPGGVKSVGARAFKNCTGFTYAQIAHGVESIGEEAFYGCWRITEVDVPSSVSSIGQNAFGGDSSITKVALRGDIRQMSQIFANHQSIREATVKTGRGSLVDGLFGGCSSLKTVRFLGDCPALANNGANLYQDANWSLVTYVSKDSTGWDGTAGSHTLPMAWPLVGGYRRSITYADDISAPHAVAFDANGGTPKTQNVEQRSETPFVLPKEPTRAGYTFAGWWTEKNGGVKVTEGTVFIEGVYSYLYAHWLKPGQIVLEGVFSGTGKVSLDENGNIVVVLTVDVSGTVEIPDNVGSVTIDLNGYVMTGDDGPAIRIVKGDDEGVVTLEATKLAIVDTSDGESGRITGGGESAGIEIAEDAALRVRLDVEDDVSVFNGDGTEQDWRELSPVEFTLVAGEYVKMTLAELGYDVPMDGTPYNVVAKGLPAGLKLMYNKAVTKKVKGKTVVVKAAKSEWWIEGVPTAAMDFFTNPPYLVITANGETTTETLPVEVAAQEVVDLGELALEQSINTNGWLAGVGAGWTVSGLPTGLKYATKKVTKKVKSGKRTVTQTVAEAYAVYGKTTKAGLFTITAKKKKGAYYETMKYRVLVRPKAVDTVVFGESLTNITTMAYVPVEWDLTNDVASVGGKVAKVAGLPTGLTFAASNTYAYKNAKKKTGKYLKQYGQTIIGTPKKPGTYVVTFTKNVTTGTGKKKKTVAKTAQILWVVEPNDAELELGFNTAGGVVESGVVGLKYDGLMAFTATTNATVTASGMPAGVKLVNLDNGQYAFTGFTTKAGTYLVTVKATLNRKTVTQRVALEVEGLPAWAKGTFNGYVTGDVQGSYADEQQLVPPGGISGLSTITVSAVGKVSGKFHEFGTNWTFSAASYTGYDETAPAYTVPVTAKYAYKVPEKVKSGKKTVTKMVTKYVTRTMTLTVGADALGGVATLAETDGSTVVAWQNRWGSTYKAVGTKLFTTKSGKKTLAYKTFTIKGTTEEGAAIGLMASETLSLKVAPNGAVAATLSFDTGKTKKDAKTKKTVKVIYTATCNTVVTPTSPADADPFTGEVYLYFAPSPANGFPGYVGVLPL